MEKETNLKKELGLFVATALVAGNMIGSGVFMLPSTLALKSGPGATMIAWFVTGIGSIFLALSFAKLGSKIPKSGGPYEYSKVAFGDFVGFLNAWLYWTASWIGNAAIITAVASYSGSLIPAIKNSGVIAFLYTSALLWLFTIINILGTKKAGIIQTVLTIFKLLLFLIFIIVAAYHFNSDFITPIFPEGKGVSTIPAAAVSTLWAFTGFESSSVNAEEIKNPKRNVGLSTILGISIAIIAYMLISFFSMGAMSQGDLAQKTSPIVDIMAQYLGKGVIKFLLIGSIISVLGTIIGWILTTARMSYAVARDGIFPGVFKKVHPKYNTPYVSLIINAILTNILLYMNYSESLLSAFNFMILLATLSYLPVYALTSAAEILILTKREKDFTVSKFLKGALIPLLGFIYALWAIYGAGEEAVFYGFLLMLSGVPFYLYMKIKGECKNLNSMPKKEIA
ncbi:APC family permease [Clostridium rectalis]|uniref:APC family permease n=1 Tax=Clostridium rectalis TaxID=2040295 RepID=UPI000F63BAE1|nr:amino acid permease [Clostridium rectalis]